MGGSVAQANLKVLKVIRLENSSRLLLNWLKRQFVKLEIMGSNPIFLAKIQFIGIFYFIQLPKSLTAKQKGHKKLKKFGPFTPDTCFVMLVLLSANLFKLNRTFKRIIFY